MECEPQSGHSVGCSRGGRRAAGKQRPRGEVPVGGVTQVVVSVLPDINPRVPPGETPAPTDSSTRQGYWLMVYIRSTDHARTSSDFAKCSVSGGPFMSSPSHSPSVFTVTVAVARCSGHGSWSISPRYKLPALSAAYRQ